MLATICVLAASVAADAANERLATLRAHTLDVAVMTYRTRNNEWPKQLADVAPYLEEGKKGLTSPWGAPYQFIRVPDEKGVVRPYIWTQREVDGKARVYGTKPPDKK